MAKAILICGKICSGKTTYAKELCQEYNAILLSSDELVSALFHPNENEYHDRIIGKVHKYLLEKSVEVICAGTNIVLDWGFWTRADRTAVTEFYYQKGIETEWHYLNIDKEKWASNIRKRNDAVLNKETMDYFVDQGLLDKLESLFEIPDAEEMDVWIE